MVVDDHAINSLSTWFELAYQELKNEWLSGQYMKLSDCPAFKATAAYQEAMSVLSNGSNSPEVVEGQLKRMLDEEIQVESFWKEHKKK